MVIKVLSKDGRALEVYPSREVPVRIVNSIRNWNTVDSVIANALEDSGWRMMAVFPVSGLENCDKEIWFRKD